MYIITNDKYSDSAYSLKKIFKNRIYRIEYITKNKYTYNKTKTNRTRNQHNQHLEHKKDIKNKKSISNVYKALNHSYDHNPDAYTLILKDSSIYQLKDKSLLDDIIMDTMDMDDWDISYLCRWMDLKSKTEYVTNIDYIEILKI